MDVGGEMIETGVDFESNWTVENVELVVDIEKQSLFIGKVGVV